ncbi:putative ejection protein [Pseudoalteromonas virus vB_PspP-H6/1]|nr:putative ejection protein [Pseudoalteromonas virus vB_PspP-H6/1]
MYNFDVNTVDLSAFQKGLNIADDREQRKKLLEQQQQQELAKKQQTQQIQSLSQAALSGDPKALASLAAIDPTRANKLQSFQASQKPELPDMAALGEDLKVVHSLAQTGSPMLGQSLGTLLRKYRGTGFDNEIMSWAQQYDQDPATAVSQLGQTVGAFSEPEKGTNYKPTISTPQVDETGQQYIIITDPNTQQTSRVDVVGGKVETGDAKMNREIRKGLLEDAAEVSRESFDQLKTVRSQIGNFDTAIKALDQGAQSGPFQSMLPSIKQSTIELENAAQRLGLDVISATTFGALSEGELRLAMNTAVPLNLEPKELKQWLSDKKKAQQKLGNELYKMATGLGKGKMTIAEYLEKNNYSAKPQEQQSESQPSSSAGGSVVNWADL